MKESQKIERKIPQNLKLINTSTLVQKHSSRAVLTIKLKKVTPRPLPPVTKEEKERRLGSSSPTIESPPPVTSERTTGSRRASLGLTPSQSNFDVPLTTTTTYNNNSTDFVWSSIRSEDVNTSSDDEDDLPPDINQDLVKRLEIKSKTEVSVLRPSSIDVVNSMHDSSSSEEDDDDDDQGVESAELVPDDLDDMAFDKFLHVVERREQEDEINSEMIVELQQHVSSTSPSLIIPETTVEISLPKMSPTTTTTTMTTTTTTTTTIVQSRNETRRADVSTKMTLGNVMGNVIKKGENTKNLLSDDLIELFQRVVLGKDSNIRWATAVYESKNKLIVGASGTGGFVEMKKYLSDDEIIFGILRCSVISAANVKKEVSFLVSSIGMNVSNGVNRGKAAVHGAAIKKMYEGKVQYIYMATDKDDLNVGVVEEKVLSFFKVNSVRL
jgi:hypothetical protein